MQYKESCHSFDPVIELSSYKTYQWVTADTRADFRFRLNLNFSKSEMQALI